MRLLKIGRDASCDIVLQSDKVSSLHAEMTVLNNGDILLEDKNSRNGTFLMNKPIKPGTSVSVRRGDAIRFADVELMWNQIPMAEDNSNYKALFGIGTNFRNEIQISGNTASRFHATLKISKDGKPYIQDHSKNGTTVNGTRIAFGQNVRIKRSDAIVCGGIPVDVKRFIPQNIWPKAIVGIGVAALMAGLIVLVAGLVDRKPTIKALESATTCVIGNYYVVATLEDDPFKEVFKDAGWPQEWVFGMLPNDKKAKPVLKDFNDQVIPFSYTGTAFFISSDGYLGTNRHIALPWKYINAHGVNNEEIIKQFMAEYRNAYIPINELKTYAQLEELKNASGLGKILHDYLMSSNEGEFNRRFDEINGWIARFKSSKLNLSGKMVGIDVALKGSNITYTRELLPCHVVAESGDENKDVALIRLNNKQTPDKIVKNGYFDINRARLNEKTLIPQQEDLITLGYPYELLLGMDFENKALKPTIHKISVSKEPNDNGFQFQGEELGGASGSPIVDNEHRLVGVLYGGYSVGATFGLACNIKHLKELYDKHKETDE